MPERSIMLNGALEAPFRSTPLKEDKDPQYY